MNFFGDIEIPGHEKTQGTLSGIVDEYRKASYATGKYDFNQSRQDIAIEKIMELS